MCIRQNDAEGPTQVGFFDFIDIDAIIADLAVLDVVKAVDQVCDCRLTGPGGADKCDFCPGFAYSFTSWSTILSSV